MIKLTAKNYNNSIAPHRREWPKYSTQLLNIATQNCQALRAKFVGSMKETWLEMKKQNLAGTLDTWTDYYNSTHGTDGLVEASKKTFVMIKAMGITRIEEAMCLDYIKEVVYNKTHMGMGGEETAVQVVADYYKLPYRWSTAEEESRGIDAWIDDKPVQVKPEGSAFKGHVHNHADTTTELLITYTPKKKVCYIHNPEFMNVHA